MKRHTVYRIISHGLSNLVDYSLVAYIFDLFSLDNHEARLVVIVVVLPTIQRAMDSNMLKMPCK